MKYLLIVCALVVVGCSGSSSPTAPSTPTYPNLIGSWPGTATFSATVGGQSGSNVCQTTWVINSETNGAVSGTFQLSGGTVVSCAQSGSFAGTVTTGGAVDVTFTASTPPAGCAVTSRSDLAGIVTGSSLTLQQTTTLTCNGSPATQGVTVALTKS